MIETEYRPELGTEIRAAIKDQINSLKAWREFRAAMSDRPEIASQVDERIEDLERNLRKLFALRLGPTANHG